MAQTHGSPNEITGARLVPYSQQWHTAKIIIRVVIFCLCALAFGLSFLSSTYSTGMGPVVIADVAWLFAEFIALAIRHSKKRGIHPIPHLILDTLFPPAYFFVAFDYGHDMSNSHLMPRNHSAEVFVMVFVVALMILHAVLFVRSCIEVHQRRLSRAAPKTMYYIPGQGAPFVANREPLAAEMGAVAAAAPSSKSVISLPEKQEPKTAGSHAQLGTD